MSVYESDSEIIFLIKQQFGKCFLCKSEMRRRMNLRSVQSWSQGMVSLA